MKTVFILGAGASKQAGAPLMTDFLDHAQDLLRVKRSGVEKVKNEFEDVFNAIAELQAVHAKSYLDLDNLEVIFGAIEMARLLQRFGHRDAKAIEKLRNSLIKLIYKSLELSIPFPITNSGSRPGDRRIMPPEVYQNFMNMIDKVMKSNRKNDPLCQGIY